jgi:hypothetical protein
LSIHDEEVHNILLIFYTNPIKARTDIS